MCKNAKGLRYIMCCLVSPDKALEVHGSTLAILLGIWLFFSDVFSVSDVYIMMRSVASEKWWSLVFITVGIVQLYSILTTRTWQYKIGSTVLCPMWLRKHILLAKGALWCMLMIGVLYGDYRALSAPMYATFSFNAFRGFFCLKTGQSQDDGTKNAL